MLVWVFDTAEADSPCSSQPEACAGAEATSEARMQVAAEYCADHTLSDAACAGLVMRLERSLGEKTPIMLDYAGLCAPATTTFVPGGVRVRW